MDVLNEFDTTNCLDLDLWSINEKAAEAIIPAQNNSDLPVIINYCKICMNSNTYTKALNCNHSFCVDCVILLLHHFIESGNVSSKNAVCPECEIPIAHEIYESYLSQEMFSRYDYLFEKQKNNDLVMSGSALFCPAPDCPGFAFVIPDQDISACVKCFASICTKCKSSTHPGQTCEEYANENKDEHMDDLLRSRLWKRCPTCGVAVERTEGCNFMVCFSNLCNGGNAFCYACGKYLVEEYYYMHFSNPMIGDNDCNTILGDIDHE